MEVWEIAGIKIQNLHKTYEVPGRQVPVFCGLDLELDTSCITVVLGKSGCGKTTLLRLILGPEQYESGEICSAEGLKTGIVFQELRLMPWLNVWQNITFGLKKKEIDVQNMEQLIAMTGLTGFEKAYPSQLSGGMQQRAALARALSCEPDYILMDEPFAALDHFTRKTMQDELLRIQREQKKGMLFVTHSIDEALILGHRLVILENGVCKKIYDLETRTFETAVICTTVGLMCPVMSFLAAWLYYPYYAGFNILTLLANWLKLVCLNFPFAFFSQLFFIQPLVRTVFKLLFRKETVNETIPGICK